MLLDNGYPTRYTTTYRFAPYNDEYMLTFNAYEGEFSNITMSADEYEECARVRTGSIEYWMCVVFFHLEDDPNAPGYSCQDLYRAAQAALFIGKMPEFPVMNELIGYRAQHRMMPDAWVDVQVRAQLYKDNFA